MAAAEQDTTSKARLLFELADTQAGYFTAKQAEQAGYSRRMQHYHWQAGHWERTARGLYRLRDYPLDIDQQYAELMLWSRNLHDQPQAVAGFETALQLHELSEVNPADIHLIVPPGFRKKPPVGVILHFAVLDPQDVQERGAYRVTTPLRTLLDAAHNGLSPEHLQTAMLDAVRLGLVRASSLKTAFQAADLPVQVRPYVNQTLEQL